MKNIFKINWLLLFIAFFATAAVLMMAGVVGATKPQGGNLVFILDASGSMWGQVEGKAKIVIAKEVLAGLIEELPDGLNVGLVAYGHRLKGDCSDVEELVPLGVIDKQNLIKKIKALNPRGKTPITLSVKITAEKIKALEDETTIILVSDGKETCKGDPCALVKELRESGVRFIMHAIGFDVTAEERKQLECIAGAGGGTYYAAKNAGEFQMAAKKVIKQPEFIGGLLKVTATKVGKPFRASVYVYQQGEKNRLAYRDAHKDKPASFKLLSGVYDIKVTDDSVPDKPMVNFKGIEIKSGETLEKIAEFTQQGILEVTVVKGGKPFKARVYVYRQGETSRLAYEDAHGDKPASFKLLPGLYDIKVTDDSVLGKPMVNFKGIEIKSGETLEKIAEFTQQGILEVTAVKGGKPFKARVYVYRQGETSRLAYEDAHGDKPASFKLLPGLYDIKVTDDSVLGKPMVNFKGIEIKSGETLEKIAEFTQQGILEVTAVKGGKPFKARVYVYRQGETSRLAYEDAHGDKPASFKLLPGLYDIKVTDDSVLANPWSTSRA